MVRVPRSGTPACHSKGVTLDVCISRSIVCSPMKNGSSLCYFKFVASCRYSSVTMGKQTEDRVVAGSSGWSRVYDIS